MRHRYIIVLDRYDDDDYGPRDYADGHDGSPEGARQQVAAELQEAMDATGMPAGFFNVIARKEVPSPGPNVGTISADELRAEILPSDQGWT